MSMTKEDFREIQRQIREIAKTQATAPVPAGMVPAPDDKPWYEDAYDATKEFVTGGDAKADLETRNISTDTIQNFDKVYDASAGPEEQDRLIQYMNKNPDMLFDIDKPTGRLLQRNSPEKQWSIINSPGLDSADIAELGGELVSMGLGTMGMLSGRSIANALKKYGGYGGKKFKFISGLAGALLGAKAGGERQITLAEESGQLAHRSPEEIEKLRGWAGHPGKMAIGEVFGEAASRLIGGTVKKAWGMFRGTDIPKDLRERALNIPENMPSVINEINDMLKQAGINKSFNPDSARILNEPEFMRAVLAIEQGGGEPGHRIVRQLYGNNQEALKEFLDLANKKQELPVTDPIPEGPSPELQVGENIQNVVKKEIGEGEEAVVKAVQDAASGELATRTSVETAGGVSSREVGEILRPEVKATYDELVATMKSKFEGLETEVLKTQPKFMPTNTLKTATELQEKLGKGPARGTSLSEGEDILVTQIKENVSSIHGRGMAKPLTYQEITDYIQLLRKGIRRSQKSQAVGSGLDLGVLYQLENAAVLDRKVRLEGMPNDIAQKHLDLEKAYTAQKTLIESRGVQNILAWDSKGPKLQDDQLFKKIFGGEGGATRGAADNVISLLEKGTDIGSFEAIRRAIFTDFVRKSTIDEGGEIIPAKAGNWLRTHEENLKTWLSADEIKTLTNAKDSGELLKKARTKATNWDKDMKEIFGPEYVRIKNGEAADVFDTAWKSASTITKHKELLQTKYPHVWEQLHNAGLRNIKRDLLSIDEVSKAARDFKTVNQYNKARPKSEQMTRTEFDNWKTREGETTESVSYDQLKRRLGDYKWVDKVRAVYGDEYVSSLIKLRNAAEILGRNPGKIKSDTNNPFVEMISAVAFGPLNHKRFAYKAMKKYAQNEQNINFANLVLDPYALNRAAKSGTTSEFQKQMQLILGGQVGRMITRGEAYDDQTALDALTTLRKNINLPGNAPLRDKLQRALTVGP